MPARTVRAHFDGQQVRLDEPHELEPNTPLLIVALPLEDDESEDELWLRFSAEAFARTYDADEPEYPTSAIRAPNPEYARR